MKKPRKTISREAEGGCGPLPHAACPTWQRLVLCFFLSLSVFMMIQVGLDQLRELPPAASPVVHDVVCDRVALHTAITAQNVSPTLRHVWRSAEKEAAFVCQGDRFGAASIIWDTTDAP